MIKSKYTTFLCIIISIITVVLAIGFTQGEALGIEILSKDMPYTESLFSTDYVHTLDIVVKESDWENMLENALEKEYISCSVVIDGESLKNVGIRTKGNSTLSTIANSESDRYSFKIEFDHYETGKNHMGLDKLALNNIAQDNTYMKDYMSYQMMNSFSAYAPLSSFIYITVNGEEWGLYLAVEGIEDSFLTRTYGTNSDGKLYKPETMDMAGGMGNVGGDMVNGERPQFNEEQTDEIPEGFQNGDMGNAQIPQFGGNENEKMQGNMGNGQIPQFGGNQTGEMPEGFQNGKIPEGFPDGDIDDTQMPQFAMGGRGGNESDAALIYTDDEYESYSNLFEGAKSDINNADKDRLISSIKQLNEGENLDDILDVEEVLRYFVVHNFVLNFDSYTGNMLHNYYLYEEDGQLSMIAWDYNLAFGGFSMGRNMGGNSSGESTAIDTATQMVNFPIDTPVSGTTLEQRPLLNQLLSNEEYLEMYHQLFEEFVTEYFNSGVFEEFYDKTISLISPYVEKDPTAFCEYDEFVQASEVLKEFCLLRSESIEKQVDGAIPTTDTEQVATSYSGLVDASHLDTSVMGSQGGMGGNSRNQMGGFAQDNNQTNEEDNLPQDNPEEFVLPEGNMNNAEGRQNENGQNNGFNMQGGRQQMNNVQTKETSNNLNYIFLFASILLLILGILFVFKFKKF